MDSDILEFLPKYSNIHNFDNDLLNPYDNFNISIASKKEFIDEKILKNDVPVEGEKLFKAQKFVMKFLSSYTPYDQLLLFHEMGVGKSRATISAIENIKKENYYNFDGAIIVGKGQSILKNFKDEIIQYTDEYYPPNYNDLPENLQKRRLNASIKKFYSFKTFVTFANSLSCYDDERIKEEFSNKIISIDEIHNLREDLNKNTNNIWYYDEIKTEWYNPLTKETVRDKPKKMNKSWIALKDKNNRIIYKNINDNTILQKHPFNVNPYKEFHRLLHNIKNSKVILLSGTPMKDSFKEISSVMNLILPMNEQLPVKSDFARIYFEKSGDFYTVKESTKKDLKNKFKGRVSYLKAITSEVQKKFMGQKITSLKYFTVYPVIMSDIQTEFYKIAYGRDNKKFKNFDNEDLSTENDEEDEEFEDDEGDFEDKEEAESEALEAESEALEAESEALEEESEALEEESEALEEENIYVKFQSDSNVIGYGFIIDKKFYKDYNITNYDEKYIYIFEFQYDIRDDEVFFKPSYNVVKISEDNIKYSFKSNKLKDLASFILKDREQNELFDGAVGDKESSSFYYHSRQASLFIFPDGTYGKAGYLKHVKNLKNGQFSLSKEVLNALSGNTNEEKLEKLEKYSPKYAEVVKKLLHAYDGKKCSFVYCNSVTGSGLIVFSLILKLFGFSSASGSEKTKGKRFAFFLTTGADFSNLKEKFNRYENRHGEYMSVVLGSRSISEGYSFKNILEEHIITPHYNYAEIDQSIARGFRFKSHMHLVQDCKNKLNAMGYNYDLENLEDVNQVIEDCKSENIEFPELKIFQYVAIPNDKKTPSVDIEFYKISEIKDVNIKKIERIMKEAAIDCSINKERNLIGGYDNLRECEYMSCQYECDDIKRNFKPEIDDTTNFIYHFKNSKIYNDLKSKILNIFRVTFKIDFENLRLMFPLVKNNYILQILYDLIVDKERILNKYNIQCYLKEHNNIFFLTDDFSDNNVLVEFYTKNPNIIEYDAFDKYFKKLTMENAPLLINSLFNLDEKHKRFKKRILGILKKIDMESQEILLEYCIIADENENKTKEFHRKYLLSEVFVGKYRKINDIYISWLLFDDKIKNYNKLRCNKNINDEWQDCEENEIELFMNKDENRDIENIKNNIYGYYGILEKDKKTDIMNFKLVKILKEKTEKKNKIPSGKVCYTFDMFELIDILEKLQIYPSNENSSIWKKLEKMNKQELLSINVKKNLKIKIDEIGDDVNLIRKYIFWYDFDRKIICDKIFNVMKDKGLIIQ